MRRPYDGIRPITSDYGNRTFWLNGQQISDFHNGIDIGGVFDALAASAGNVIAAFAGGRVDAEPNINTPASYVILDHGNGLKTLYWHLSQVNVNVGQHVDEGQKIGITGRTGYATGEHLHFATQLNGVYQNPRSYIDFGDGTATPIVNGDYITVQNGWGLSNVAVAAGLPTNEDTYTFIYNLNQGLRGSWDWGSLNARMGAGDQLRVKVAQVEQPKPEIPVTNPEIEKLKADISKLQDDKAKSDKEAQAKFEELANKEAEKDKLQEEELAKVKEEKRIELEALSKQMSDKQAEYDELVKLSNPLLTITDAKFTGIVTTGIVEELKARGIQQIWHNWIDAHFQSNFVKQLLKYTWPAWIFFLATTIFAVSQMYHGDNQLILTAMPILVTIAASLVQFMVTNYDKNKDNRVDINDFPDIFKP